MSNREDELVVDISKYVHGNIPGNTRSGMNSSLVSFMYMEALSKMNIPTVKRQVIRAYIFLFVNGLLNLTFVLATVGFLVFGLLSIFGNHQWIETSQLVRGYALIFIVRVLWTVAYHFARKRIQKQFEDAGIGIGSSGTEQVTGIINVLNHKTELMKREKDAIMAKHGNDVEKAKKELVLLQMKYGGKVHE